MEKEPREGKGEPCKDCDFQIPPCDPLEIIGCYWVAFGEKTHLLEGTLPNGQKAETCDGYEQK